jgi:hypothetical protein
MIGLIPMLGVGNLVTGISLFWLSFGNALPPSSRKRQDEAPISSMRTNVFGDEPLPLDGGHITVFPRE